MIEKGEMKEILDLTRIMIGLCAVLWILFSFIIGIKVVPDNDMAPGVCAGDLVFYYRLDKRPDIREIIIFEKNGSEYLGRIIASGGDKVEITENSVLMVNDNVVFEENIFCETPPYEGFTEYPLILEADEKFVLCDKREGGKDSRYFGPVKDGEIEGTMVAQYRRGSI